MRDRDRLAGAALVLLAAAVAWETRRLPFGTLRDPGPGYMPMLLAVILGGLGLYIALRGSGASSPSTPRWPEARQAVAILIGSGAAAFLLERLGYRLTVLLFVAFLAGVLERKPPAVTAALALGLSLGTFFLFADLLKVPLPRGPLGF